MAATRPVRAMRNNTTLRLVRGATDDRLWGTDILDIRKKVAHPFRHWTHPISLLRYLPASIHNVSNIALLFGNVQIHKSVAKYKNSEILFFLRHGPENNLLCSKPIKNSLYF